MSSSDELGIGDRIDRLEEIAETLEEGNVDLETAKELRETADEHLEALRTELTHLWKPSLARRVWSIAAAPGVMIWLGGSPRTISIEVHPYSLFQKC